MNCSQYIVVSILDADSYPEVCLVSKLLDKATDAELVGSHGCRGGRNTVECLQARRSDGRRARRRNSIRGKVDCRLNFWRRHELRTAEGLGEPKDIISTSARSLFSTR